MFSSFFRKSDPSPSQRPEVIPQPEIHQETLETISIEIEAEVGGGKGMPSDVSCVYYHRKEGLCCVGTKSGAVYAFGDGFQYMRPWLVDYPNEVIFIAPIQPDRLLVAFLDNSLAILDLPFLNVIDLKEPNWIGNDSISSMHVDEFSDYQYCYIGTDTGFLHVLQLQPTGFRVCEYFISLNDVGITQELAVLDIQVCPKDEKYLAIAYGVGRNGVPKTKPDKKSKTSKSSSSSSSSSSTSPPGAVIIFDLSRHKPHKQFLNVSWVSCLSWNQSGEALYAGTLIGDILSFSLERTAASLAYNVNNERNDEYIASEDSEDDEENEENEDENDGDEDDEDHHGSDEEEDHEESRGRGMRGKGRTWKKNPQWVPVRRLTWLSPQEGMGNNGAIFALIGSFGRDSRLKSIILTLTENVGGTLSQAFSVPPLQEENVLSFRLVPTISPSSAAAHPTPGLLLLTQKKKGTFPSPNNGGLSLSAVEEEEERDSDEETSPNKKKSSSGLSFAPRLLRVARCPTSPLSDWNLEIGSFTSLSLSPTTEDHNHDHEEEEEEEGESQDLSSSLPTSTYDPDGLHFPSLIEFSPHSSLITAVSGLIPSTLPSSLSNVLSQFSTVGTSSSSSGRRLSAREFFSHSFSTTSTSRRKIRDWELVLATGELENGTGSGTTSSSGGGGGAVSGIKPADLIFLGHENGDVIVWSVSRPPLGKEYGRGNTWHPLRAFRQRPTSSSPPSPIQFIAIDELTSSPIFGNIQSSTSSSHSSLPSGGGGGGLFAVSTLSGSVRLFEVFDSRSGKGYLETTREEVKSTLEFIERRYRLKQKQLQKEAKQQQQQQQQQLQSGVGVSVDDELEREEQEAEEETEEDEEEEEELFVPLLNPFSTFRPDDVREVGQLNTSSTSAPTHSSPSRPLSSSSTSSSSNLSSHLSCLFVLGEFNSIVAGTMGGTVLLWSFLSSSSSLSETPLVVQLEPGCSSPSPVSSIWFSTYWLSSYNGESNVSLSIPSLYIAQSSGHISVIHPLSGDVLARCPPVSTPYDSLKTGSSSTSAVLSHSKSPSLSSPGSFNALNDSSFLSSVGSVCVLDGKWTPVSRPSLRDSLGLGNLSTGNSTGGVDIGTGTAGLDFYRQVRRLALGSVGGGNGNRNSDSKHSANELKNSVVSSPSSTSTQVQQTSLPAPPPTQKSRFFSWGSSSSPSTATTPPPPPPAPSSSPSLSSSTSTTSSSSPVVAPETSPRFILVVSDRSIHTYDLSRFLLGPPPLTTPTLTKQRSFSSSSSSSSSSIPHNAVPVNLIVPFTRIISNQPIIAGQLVSYLEEATRAFSDPISCISCVNSDGNILALRVKDRSPVCTTGLLDGVLTTPRRLSQGIMLTNGDCYLVKDGSLIFSASPTSHTHIFTQPLPTRSITRSVPPPVNFLLQTGREDMEADKKMKINKRRSSMFVAAISSAPTDLDKIFSKTRSDRMKDELLAGSRSSSTSSSPINIQTTKSVLSSTATLKSDVMNETMAAFQERGEQLSRMAEKMDRFKEHAQTYRDASRTQRNKLKAQAASYSFF